MDSEGRCSCCCPRWCFQRSLRLWGLFPTLEGGRQSRRSCDQIRRGLRGRIGTVWRFRLPFCFFCLFGLNSKIDAGWKKKARKCFKTDDICSKKRDLEKKEWREESLLEVNIRGNLKRKKRKMKRKTREKSMSIKEKLGRINWVIDNREIGGFLEWCSDFPSVRLWCKPIHGRGVLETKQDKNNSSLVQDLRVWGYESVRVLLG